MEYLALALAPGIAISLYFFYKDIYNREPKLNLAVSFILGCLAVLPAIWLESSFGNTIDGSIMGVAILAYAVVGFSEEAVKYIGLRFYSYNQKSFDEPLDGIVYSVIVSMGFATVENVMYVMKYSEQGMGLQVGVLRMFLSVPAHATFGVIMGYFVGKAKFSPDKRLRLMVMGLLGATFFHGTYDFFLFLPKYSYVGQQLSEILLAGGAITSYIVCLILSRKMLRSQRNISQIMFKDKNRTTSV
jgi:RsiW-degrading membrane proteinase PrsW (M82 family)